jgi:class 3 adenylate cyclase/tetratricopeptide (TPR) repeat protein
LSTPPNNQSAPTDRQFDPQTDSLAPYVSALTIRSITKNASRAREPSVDEFQGAVLFADVSGFTALTERLTQKGEGGVETLTRVLNAYFGQLIDLVLNEGGDIVKFAGDALLAVWPASNELNEEKSKIAMVEANLRAAQCGLSTQIMMGQFKPPDGLKKLSLRVAIGSGEFTSYHIGGQFQRYEFVLGGEPIRQVEQAGLLCQPGEVVLSAESLALIENDCDGQKRGEEVLNLRRLKKELPPFVYKAPEVSNSTEEILRDYIPGAIRRRLDAGQNIWLAELRQVTVLFVNLPDLRSQITLEKAQAGMRALQSAIYRFEGSVNKLSVDDKGVSLLAAFGLPPLSHEDDPVRGLRTALELREGLTKLGWQCSIGVATGEAFCGLVGSNRRCEYTMMGDVVNLAARLMQAANGNILCDFESQKRSHAAISFEKLGPLALKGKSAPVQVFRPSIKKRYLTERRKSLRRMIGRQKEKDSFQECINDLEQGRPRVVILEGEAGSGKSCFSFAISKLLSEIPYFIGEAEALEKVTPYYIWRQILFDLLKLNEIESVEDQRTHVRAQLEDQPQLQRLLPLLNAILPLEFPEAKAIKEMAGEIRAQNTRRIIVHIIQISVGDRPTVFELGNAHWMDSPSWALTWFVSNDIPNVMLLITSRPFIDQLPPEYIQLKESTKTQSICLERLPDKDIEKVLCLHLEVRKIPEKVSRLVCKKAQGNPFFALQLTYSLRDSKILVIENGESRLEEAGNPLESLKFPDSVQGVIVARIDRLDASEQILIKVASVVGHMFLLELVKDIFPVSDSAVDLDALFKKLCRLGFLQPTPDDDELHLSFVHYAIQEATYKLMLRAQKSQIHRAAANWYEAKHEDHLEPFYTLLAYHWKNAEDPIKAIDYYEKSAIQASQNYANEEVLAALEEAIKLEEQHSEGRSNLRQARWHQYLGDAHYSLARWAQSESHFLKSMELLGRPIATSSLGRIFQALGAAFQQFCHRIWTRLALGREKEQGESLRPLVCAHERLAQICFMRSDNLGFVLNIVRGLNIAESVGPSPELARSYSLMSLVTVFVTLRLSRTYGELAKTMVGTLNDPDSRTHFLELTAVVQVACGQLPDARGTFDGARRHADTHGDSRRWEECSFGLGNVLRHLGVRQESVNCFTDLYQSGLRRSILQIQLWGLAGKIGSSLMGSVDKEDVEKLQSLVISVQKDARILASDVIHAQGWLAHAYLRLGNDVKARELAETLVKRIEKNPDITAAYVLEGYIGAASTLLELWQDQGQADLALQDNSRRSCKALRRYAKTYPLGRPYAFLYTGILMALEKQAAKAQKQFELCLEVAQFMNCKAVQATAHLQCGLLSNREDPTAKEHFKEAILLFEKLEAPYEIARSIKLRNKAN